MAKFASIAVQDAPLDVISGGTEMYFCDGQPADRAAAIASARHGSAIVLSAGDFAKSSVTSTRRLTIAGKSVTASSSGNVDHVAICTASALLYVTTAPAQTANSGAAINGSAFTVDALALA